MTKTDTNIYFIEYDGKIGGRRVTGFYERDMDRTGLSATIADIMSGEVSDVVRVWCANESTGWRDVSEDVARKIIDRLDDLSDLHRDLEWYLETHLGFAAMARLERDLAPGRSDREEHSTLNRAQQGV